MNSKKHNKGSKMTDNEGQKESRKGKILQNVKSNRLIYLLLFLLILIMLQLGSLANTVAKVDRYNQGVVDEVGSINGDVKNFAGDLNEIRRFLLLPEKEYSVVGTSEDSGESGEQVVGENAALYAFLDSYSKQQEMKEKRNQAEEALNRIVADEGFRGKLLEHGLMLGERENMQVKIIDKEEKMDDQQNVYFDQPLYGLVYDESIAVFKIQSVLGDQEFKDFGAEGFSAELLAYMKDNKDAVRRKKTELSSEETKARDELEMQKKNEKEERLNELRAILKDPAFLDSLKNLDLRLEENVVSDGAKEVYNVFNNNGEKVFAIAIDVESMMMKVIVEDQENDILNYLNLDEGKKKL